MPNANDVPGYSLGADDLVDFNPLEDFGFDDGVDEEDAIEGVLGEGPFGMPNPDAVPQFQRQLVSFADGETAEERITALFGQMPTLQKMLFDILALCKAPTPTEEAEANIEEMRRRHHCVYTPAVLLDLLERAGAVAKTDPQGAPLAESEQEPLKVVVDGAEYWRVAPAPQVSWTATPAGAAHLAGYRPMELICGCYEAEPQYAEVFDAALRICARDGGASIKQVDDAVGDEPVLQKPRRFAMYFVDKLERAGAVEWDGAWKITAPGREFLATRD